MPSEYIASGEYATYGLSAGTTSAQVQAASAIIDAMLDRTKGVVWSPDANGQPSFMAGAIASQSWTTVGATVAGSSVVVTLNGKPPASLLGQPVLVDRATALAVEACVVSAVSGATITLTTLQFNHAGGVTVEAGMFLEERRTATGTRPSIFVREKPLAGLVSARRRFTGSHLGLSAGYDSGYQDFSAITSQVSSTSPWSTIDVTTLDWEATTGQIFADVGNYSEIQAFYVAGYPSTAIPKQVKLACAQIVNSQTGDAMSDAIMEDLKEAFAIRRVGI